MVVFLTTFDGPDPTTQRQACQPVEEGALHVRSVSESSGRLPLGQVAVVRMMVGGRYSMFLCTSKGVFLALSEHGS